MAWCASGSRARTPTHVLQQLAERVSPRVLRASRDSLVQTRRQLDEYFGHERRLFEIPLDWRLTTGFRRDVLRATEQIPYGPTPTSRRRRHTQRAAPTRCVRPARRSPPTPSHRAACHRVLRTGGGLGQYRGGAEAKAQLLTLEGAA